MDHILVMLMIDTGQFVYDFGYSQGYTEIRSKNNEINDKVKLLYINPWLNWWISFLKIGIISHRLIDW